MRVYELVLVLKASLKEAEKKKLLDLVKNWLSGLKVTKEEDWGQKPLAYSIKKETAGVYVNLMLEGENIPTGLEKKLLTNDNVLRHLLLRQK